MNAFQLQPVSREERRVLIPCDDRELSGSLGWVPEPMAIALIAHDADAARHRACDFELARALRGEGVATLVIDLLGEDEQQDLEAAARLRLDAKALARRLASARAWIDSRPELSGLPIAMVGEGSAGAAALIEAATDPRGYAAAVTRSAQPLRAGSSLEQCQLPVLLVVDDRDLALAALNRAALDRMNANAGLLTATGLACSANGCAAHEFSSLISRWLIEQLVGADASLLEQAARLDALP